MHEDPIMIDVMGFKIYGLSIEQIRGLFFEIFISHTYHFKTKKKRPIILDCGSNVGMSIIYFKNLYPDSIILAFEPNPDTFKILTYNILKNNIKGVVLRNIAISENYDVKLEIKNNVLRCCENKKSKTYYKASGLSLSSLLSVFKEIDCLKLDIEGNEFEALKKVFAKNQHKKIKNLRVEFH